MNNENVAEFLQKPLQEAFDAECRSYANYLTIYESLVKTWEDLEKQRDELEEKKKLEQKIVDYNRSFNSSEFDKMKKLLNLSDSEVEKITKSFSMYEPDATLSGKSLNLSYEITAIEGLLENLRESLRNIEKNVRKIVYRAHDSEAELKFPEENAVAERLLILCYYDTQYFDYYRKVIKIEDCKFSDNFVKAYLAIEGEEKAYSWFVEEAKKYKI